MPVSRFAGAFGKVLGVALAAFASAGSTAAPISSHYELDLWRGDSHLDGYAHLTWGPDGRVHGAVCTYRLQDADGRNARTDFAIISVEGTNPTQGYAEVQLTAADERSRAVLDSILPDRIVRLTKEPASLFLGAVRTPIAWSSAPEELPEGAETDSPPYYIALRRIPTRLRRAAFNFTSGQDRIVHVLDHQSKEPALRDFDLADYDLMSPEQAVALERRSPVDVGAAGISPGAVLVLIESRRRPELVDFLGSFGGTARLAEPPPPDCGAPYVLDIVDVPPLLEFYYARRLQASGLVVTAFPEILPEAMDFVVLRTAVPEIMTVFDDWAIPIAEKDARLGRFLQDQVLAFLGARRPDRRNEWHVQRVGGAPFAYRFEVIGPRVTACERSGWDKLIFQFVPRTWDFDRKLELILQIQEGFSAPGPLDEPPPSDVRFAENSLGDAPRAELQQLFGRFLEQHGFEFEPEAEPAAPPENEIVLACDLRTSSSDVQSPIKR